MELVSWIGWFRVSHLVWAVDSGWLPDAELLALRAFATFWLFLVALDASSVHSAPDRVSER